MRILSLSSVYPNPDDPGLGLFVRSRLQQVVVSHEVKVVVPIPVVDYGGPKRKLYWPRTFPMKRRDGPIEVFHPLWFFPPNGTPLNVLCLLARLFPLVRRLRKTFQFDLVDAHFGYPEGAAAALLAWVFRVPFTITLRGSETMFADFRYRRKTIRWALGRASHVIAVAEHLRQFAIEMGVPPERVTTIPNGIDAETFKPREQFDMRARHGLVSGRRIIVSAGELIEAKGHHLVIRALQNLLASGIDAEAIIIGSLAHGGRPYEKELHQLTASLGLEPRVRFTGWVDRSRFAELLSAADLFCLASFTEGWPNVVNESLACGTPVVASDVGGVPAMITSDRYGYLVPPRDQSALSAALRRGLEKSWDRSAISAWGCSRSWKQVAAEVGAVWQRLAAPAATLADQIMVS